MNIEKKLVYSQSSKSIYFFRERMFAQMYGMSLYLAIKELKLRINVTGKRYKKLQNKLVLRGGLPLVWLEKHYQEKLIYHSYGYELKGNWQEDIKDYYVWQKSEYIAVLERENMYNHQKRSEK